MSRKRTLALRARRLFDLCKLARFRPDVIGVDPLAELLEEHTRWSA